MHIEQFGPFLAIFHSLHYLELMHPLPKNPYQGVIFHCVPCFVNQSNRVNSYLFFPPGWGINIPPVTGEQHEGQAIIPQQHVRKLFTTQDKSYK